MRHITPRVLIELASLLALAITFTILLGGLFVPLLLALFTRTALVVLESIIRRSTGEWPAVCMITLALLAIVGGARIWHEQHDLAVRSEQHRLQEAFLHDLSGDTTLSSDQLELIRSLLEQLQDDALAFAHADASIYHLRRLGHRRLLSGFFFHGPRRAPQNDTRLRQIEEIKVIQEDARSRATRILTDLRHLVRMVCGSGYDGDEWLRSRLTRLAGTELILAHGLEIGSSSTNATGPMQEWQDLCNSAARETVLRRRLQGATLDVENTEYQTRTQGRPPPR